MSGCRLASNRETFVRDLLRDLCAVYLALDEQSARNVRDGSVSYSVINSLIGEAASKGVFWRLKDTAHHLFRNGGEGGGRDAKIGALVDWCVGFAFHECCKLREDSFLGQHYATSLRRFSRMEKEGEEDSSPLVPLVKQAKESLWQEVQIVLRTLRECMELLVRILPASGENCQVARWLVCEEKNAKSAFGPLYPSLVQALYKDNPAHMHTLAASDLLDCGRIFEAKELLLRARRKGALDADGKLLLFMLEHRREARDIVRRQGQEQED